MVIMFIYMFPFSTTAQTTINGSVRNKRGEPLAATVTVQSKGSAAIAGYTATDADGNYLLMYKGTADSIILSISGMNTGKHSKAVANKSGRVDFIIDEKPLELSAVTVTAPKITQRGDTITYSVDAFKDQGDRVIGDVIKKLPGIEVSSLGGISYQGRSINKFYVEGMDLLQGRYGIAVKNISAKDVASVQVLENHQPIKTLLNRVFSDRAAINIKLRDNAIGTLAMTGMAGLGYRPWMWNAEAVAMYFAKPMQNMSTYKSNNSGKDLTSEFRANYDYERVSIGNGSPLYVQSPTSPPISQKRYLYNNSHAITINQLIKTGKETETVANVHYYTDRIEKTGYSLYEQYFPGDSIFAIEEHVSVMSKIHNVELALRIKTNAENYYLDNALNLRGNWNDDTGSGVTRSNAAGLDKTISQWLNKPSFASDYTLNLIKNVKDNSYKVYFSSGWGQRTHSLTVAPADYIGDSLATSLTQDVFLREFVSVLRVSYGLKRRNFNLNYDVWGRADVQKMDTELRFESDNLPATTADSLKNDLWYNNYRTGINQNYVYKTDRLELMLNLPLTYDMKTVDDRIPGTFSRKSGLTVNPTFSVRYGLTPETTLSGGSNLNRSFGGIDQNYTGFIMHSYRSLQRNMIDRMFEIRSAGANASVSYRNVFEELFLSADFNYRYSWRNLLYGYDYMGIMNVKNTIDKTVVTDGYGINFRGSKGLGFWRAIVRLSGGYNYGRGEQLVQGEILHSRSQGYRAETGMNINPIKYLGANYSLSWNRNRSWAVEQNKRFPPITGISQDAKINLYPVKTLTINWGVEHIYNSIADSPQTVFSDAGVKFIRNKLDVELEINNIFNSKQYVSASYNDVSTYYYSYYLRPLSFLVCVRFKLI